MRCFDHRTDLPKWILSGIGQIVAEWAVLERELAELVRMLMDVDIQIGRIATHTMNSKTRIAVANNLIEARVHDGKLHRSLFDEFAKLGSHINEKLQWKRDMVAHGLWEKAEGKWWVMRLRARRPTPKDP